MSDFSLITGATSGIGEGLAISLSRSNRLILCGRNIDKLNSVKEKCANVGDHYILCLDLVKEKEFLFARTNKFLIKEGITVVNFIHCAGITTILPLRNFTIDYVNEIFDINFFSSLEIIRALLKKENKASLRNIIFLSGLWSIRGDIGNSVYAASKGAINSLVISLAQELAPKVRVNSLVPGAIITPLTEKKLTNESYRKLIEKDYPLGIGKIDDVVNFIEFLLSDKAQWITGQNLVIDGGRSTK
jgi:NAD(P)-dependent dehydrogenase (short-subunit alcohol dehydrogenase family)